MEHDSPLWRAKIVHAILNGRPEEALEDLSKTYGVTVPKVKIGRVKGFGSALGCYVAKEKTIYISSREHMFDPYVILHEFYHHLRNVGGKQRGVEKYADGFARDFVSSYEQMLSEGMLDNQ